MKPIYYFVMTFPTTPSIPEALLLTSRSSEGLLGKLKKLIQEKSKNPAKKAIQKVIKDELKIFKRESRQRGGRHDEEESHLQAACDVLLGKPGADKSTLTMDFLEAFADRLSHNDSELGNAASVGTQVLPDHARVMHMAVITQQNKMLEIYAAETVGELEKNLSWSIQQPAESCLTVLPSLIDDCIEELRSRKAQALAEDCDWLDYYENLLNRLQFGRHGNEPSVKKADLQSIENEFHDQFFKELDALHFCKASA